MTNNNQPFFTRLKNRIRDWANRNWVEMFSLLALFVLVFFLLWPRIVYTVPPGHVGVHWMRFAGGTQTAPEDIRQSGVRLIFPWDRLYMYDARVQRIERAVEGITIDGLDVSVNLVSRFLIVPQNAGFLHQTVGENYVNILLEPSLRAIVLSFISEHKAENLYSEDRAMVEARILAELRAALQDVENSKGFTGLYLTVEDVRLERIVLPEFVRDAIRRKEQLRQVAESYEFRLRIENQERERKRIEAEGIRTFQEIVSPGITQSFLRWRGIEATLKLSQSNNAKVVVIGGEDGLPLILNTDPGPDATGPYNVGPAASNATGGVGLPGPGEADGFDAESIRLEQNGFAGTLQDMLDQLGPTGADSHGSNAAAPPTTSLTSRTAAGPAEQ